MVNRTVFISLLFLCSFTAQAQAESSVTRVVKLMGSRFEITVVEEDRVEAEKAIDQAVAEISRIERMISSWDPNSQTSQINKMAGVEAVVIDPELYQLIERTQKISGITDGAFDISYASIDKIWKYDGSVSQLPDSSRVAESISKIGFQKIEMDPENHSVYLPEKGMKIGFGAVGKGYAADKAKAMLMEMGIKAGIINASGDLTTWGEMPNGKPWTVGIVNPLNKEKMFSWLPVKNSAVATSGNYEKFIMINGKKYSHIIDPRTGYPTQGLASVSVFAKQAELCDALATAFFVLGPEKAIHLSEQLPGIEVVLVEQDGKIHSSSGIQMDNSKWLEK